MKTNTSITIMVVALLIFAVSFKDPEPKPKQTVCLVLPTPELVKTYVDKYSKQGYYIKELQSQSVSTSLSRYYYSDNNFKVSKDLYGKFILIMEK